MLVAFNKMDLPAARRGLAGVPVVPCSAMGIDAVAISADGGDGLDGLRAALSALLPDAEELADAAGAGGRRRPPAGGGERRVRGRATRTSAYRVSGRRIERIAAQTNFENEESAERFQRELVRDGHRWRAAQGRASGPATRSASAARSSNGIRPRTTVDGARGRGRTAGGRRARLARRLRRHVRPDPRRPPCDRRRGRARRWASRASSSSRRRPRPTSPASRSRRRNIGWPWSRPPSRATRGSAPRAPSSNDPGPPTRSTRSRRYHGRGAAGLLWFILSADALAGFPTWKDPDRILELARLAVMPRAGEPAIDERWVTAHFPGREDRIQLLPGPRLPISGSVIRRRVAAGRSIRYLVPDAVARYIAQHRLYLEPA